MGVDAVALSPVATTVRGAQRSRIEHPIGFWALLLLAAMQGSVATADYGDPHMKQLILVAVGFLFVAGVTAPIAAYSQTAGMEHRDDRRDTRQEARVDKAACKAGDDSRAECRQDKRNTKQNARRNKKPDSTQSDSKQPDNKTPDGKQSTSTQPDAKSPESKQPKP
jgi:hypothetical protein